MLFAEYVDSITDPMEKVEGVGNLKENTCRPEHSEYTRDVQ